MRFAILVFLVAALGWPITRAVAAPDAADISGKWHFVYQTDGGDRIREADFKLDGEQVSGKFSDADVKGSFKNGKLDLAFPMTSDEANMTATLSMKGELKDGKLTGTWQFGDYNGTFIATRPAEKPASH